MAFNSGVEARAWLSQNDPQCIVLEYMVDETRPAVTAGRYRLPKAEE
ncbi:hypothetical protein [Bradyrhizobium sp. S69]|nr:hypothetical protein [Bradyrhizobium sp. S69]